jgi:RNA polymerase sigma factor (sigma-70 family)
VRRVAGTIAPELIGLAQEGDHDAITDLLRASQPDIRRYARRACRLEDVDDAVQEAMTIVSRRIASLRSPAAYIGWLFVTVRRQCSRLARSMRHANRPIDDFADRIELSERPEAELRFDLASAIQSLPGHYRTILLLRDVEEFSIGEIAERTGLSREATKARLRRARLMIREYLAD